MFQHGIFTNSIVVELMRRINMPIESVLNFILPRKKGRFLSLGDNIAKINSRYTVLSSKITEKEKGLKNPKLIPIIKSDGTLFLIQNLIDQEYAGQLKDFFKDLESDSSYLHSTISRILIEGITGLQHNNIASILSNFICFEKPKSAKMKILSIGNICAS